MFWKRAIRDYIYIPYSKQQVQWLWQNNDTWAVATANFPGKIDNHYPKQKILQFLSIHPLIFPKVVSLVPIPGAETVFTDGSSHGTACYVLKNTPITWQTGLTSAQEVELTAVKQAITAVSNTPFDLYSDSRYIIRALLVLETVPFIGTANSTVRSLFLDIQALLRARKHRCYFGHIRAHSDLPGPLAGGNRIADLGTQILYTKEQQALASHALHHQNSQSLRLQFGIPREAARQIVKNCSSCPQTHPVPHFGVNPRGLLPNHLWQMDVTHVPSFGKSRFVHVTIDTFSGFLLATPLTGESRSHVIQHCLHCFSVTGLPKSIKTDNGPGYTGKRFQTFCFVLFCFF